MGYWGGLAASWLREARDRASIILAKSELGGSLWMWLKWYYFDVVEFRLNP